MTDTWTHAIITLPGSERLEGEPGQVGREKPVEEKGASLNSETESIQENQAAERDGSWKTRERVKPELSREAPENHSTESARTGRRSKEVACRGDGERPEMIGEEDSEGQTKGLLGPGLFMYFFSLTS